MLNTASANPTINNCTFVGNYARFSGGEIYNSSSSPTLTNDTFRGNKALGGGGIWDDPSSSPTVLDCWFLSNIGDSLGGGMYDDSTTIVTNCGFQGNCSGQGAGLYEGASATVTNCVFDGNTTSNPDVPSSFGSGGGAFMHGGMLVNCIFSGNRAPGSNGHGGGVVGFPNIINCTFSANSAGADGGGIYGAPVAVTNCILWGDSAPTGPEVYVSSGSVQLTYSDIQGGYAGTGNINADPKFVLAPSPGSDGTWGTADDDYGNLRLQVTSPSIDAGSNAVVPADVTTDLAGKSRILGASVDMGAYEHGTPVTVTGTSGDDNYYVRQSADGSALQVWTGTATVGNPAFTFPTATLASCTFDTGLGDDRLTVDASNGLSANIDFLAGDGNDKLLVTGLSASANLNVQPGSLSLGTANIAWTNAEGTDLGVTTGTLIKLNSLNVADSLALPAGNQLVLDVSQLAISETGKLDLNDSDLIVRNGNLAAITSALQAGFNQAAGGYWNGSTGIVSTAAAADSSFLTTLGVATDHTGTFDDQAVNAGDVLVKYTYYGDADLSGKVDGTDYSLIDVGYNSHGVKTGWQNGDFNYDGKIDGSDYSLIDNAFNMQGASLAASAQAALASKPAVQIFNNKSGRAAIAGARAYANPSPADPTASVFNTSQVPSSVWYSYIAANDDAWLNLLKRGSMDTQSMGVG